MNMRKHWILAPLLASTLLLSCTVAAQGNATSQDEDDVISMVPFQPGLEEGGGRRRRIAMEQYFSKNPPSLQIYQDYPKLDGAEALIPIYATAAKAIYQKNEALIEALTAVEAHEKVAEARQELFKTLDSYITSQVFERDEKKAREVHEALEEAEKVYEKVHEEVGATLYPGKDIKNTPEKAVKFSKTSPAAYKALIDGEADMIFALAPSEEQIKEAAQKKLTFTITPIAKEAFVFLVNEQNPVKKLSIKHIRDIYSGKINDWQKVGGTPGKILAFQRNEGSGSQTAMLRNVMRGTPMRKPLKIEFKSAMGQIIRAVGSYRNLDHAIGYSFRYYATVMNSIPGIRLLVVDNVAPTVKNIRNGTYPFTEDFCIVTARPLSENAKKLHDWFLSDEGQQFIEEVGYVPIKSGSR